ncbi:MAG: trigger factor [Lachnospiraceae bacterium]|nr:trigger factor [Lachnospiraceae bacterium]
MSTQVERLEHNMVRLTVEVAEDVFEEAMQYSYNRNRGRINVQGFRKGKAPRRIIEKMYGPEVFYEDAVNYAIDKTYEGAVDESGLTIVSRPSIDIVQIERGKPFIYAAEAAVRPEVTIKKYLGLEVQKVDKEVTDEDVQKALDRELEKNARLVDIDDRAAEMGDTVTLDFEGFVDGEAFEGGKGENHELVLGSGSFIPGFEEQLAGKSAGEETEVNVRFPDDYHSKDLAGKEAVFKCLIHKIARKEMPAADDEFAKDVSEFDTLEEYREDLKKGLVEDKEKAARQALENEAVAALIDEMEADIPEAMIEANVDSMARDFEMRLSQQGISLESYLSMFGMNEEAYRAQIRPQAENSIKTRLALEEVVKEAGLEIPDEKYEEELKKQAESYKMEVEKLKEMMDEESEKQMRLDMAVQEAITLITDNAVEVEKAEEPAEEKAGEEAE